MSHRVTCDLCGDHVPSVESAIDRGWYPSYIRDGEETGEAICPICVMRRCRPSDDFLPELIPSGGFRDASPTGTETRCTN